MEQFNQEAVTRKTEFGSSNLFLYESCEELQKQFYSLNAPRDVANLLSIQYRQLVYHLYKDPQISKYRSFEIPKKTGGSRTILAPTTALKIIQRKLSQVLYSVYNPKPSVHGFALGKSIVTNASAHSGKRYVLNVDLKDFFPSINFGRVRGMFMAQPYSLNPDVATVLAQICCYDNQLPQGAPTSPIVSNMICAKLDSQLQKVAKECNCTYTRYADDITFSTTRSNFPGKLAYLNTESKERKVILGDTLSSIIIENGFSVNFSKVRLQHTSNHQEVTGLTVNEFPNVDRRYIRQVSAMLHAWDKFGLEAANKLYREKYTKSLTLLESNPPSFKQVLYGKIDFLGLVRGKDSSIYQKHLSWYSGLAKRSKDNKSEVNQIL